LDPRKWYYDRAQEGLFKSDARRIKHELEEWFSKRKVAEKRWIWELIQNSVDCAKARGKETIRITIRIEGNKLVYEHDGGYFSDEDMTNLILGRSSKESPELTGRFAIGFIATHVLSLKVDVEGVVVNKETGERKRIKWIIDRSSKENPKLMGSWEEIEERLRNPQIEEVEYGVPEGARFIFHLDESSLHVAKSTINEMCSKYMIPLVIAILDSLLSIKTRIQISVDGEEPYTCEFVDEKYENWDGLQVKVAEISQNGQRVHVIMFEKTKKVFDEDQKDFVDRKIGLAIIKVGNKLIKLEDIPKIWCPYPLTGETENIGLPVIIYGQLKPNKYRETVNLESKSNKELIELIIRYIPEIAEYIIEKKNWEDAHWLAFIRRSKVKDEDYWNRILRENVLRHIVRHIVRIERKVLKPQEYSEFIFPFPYVMDSNIEQDREDMNKEVFNEFWTLLKNLNNDGFLGERPYLMPDRMIAYDWYLIVKEWIRLDPEYELLRRIRRVQIYHIERLCEKIKIRYKHAKLRRERVESLIKILNNVEPHARSYAKDLLSTYPILLNQREELLERKYLSRDCGIPDELKNIADRLLRRASRPGIRERLLHTSLEEYDIVSEVVDSKAGVFDVLDEISSIRPSERVSLPEEALRDWAHLLVWFVIYSKRNGIDEEKMKEYLMKLPIVTRKGTVKYFDGQYVAVLAPIGIIEHDSILKEHIAEIYPDSIIMHDIYLSITSHDAELRRVFLKTLCEQGVITTEIFSATSEYEIDGGKIREILISYERAPLRKKSYKITVSSGKPELQDMVFLDQEIIGVISQSRDMAGRFIKMLIDAIRSENIDLNKTVDVEYECDDESGYYRIYPFLWIATLRSQRWIPYEDKHLRPRDVKISILFEEKDIEELAKDELAINLLSRLGFDVVDLKIKEVSTKAGVQESQVRHLLIQALEPQLINALESLVRIHPHERREVYRKFFEEWPRVHKIIEHNKREGRRIEELVKEFLEKANVKVIRRFKGCDYEAYISGKITDEDVLRGWIGPFYIEVKKTSGNRVKMTNTQAKCARGLGEVEGRKIRPQEYVLWIVKGDVSSVEDLSERTIILEGEILKQYLEDSIKERVFVYVEPDIDGYYVKEKLWKEEGIDIDRWLEKHRAVLRGE